MRARRDGYIRSGLITPRPWDFTVTNEGVSGTASLITEPENSFLLTCPDIFRLRDEKKSIFPLGFLTSTAILYDSAFV